MKITTFLSSTRKNGNTEALTDIVLNDIEYTLINLNQLVINPVEDLRHDTKKYAPTDDDYVKLVKVIMQSDILIFSTPIYYYSMSASMKNMIDRLSQAIRDENFPNFKEHLSNISAYVITVGGDIPKIKGLAMIQQFAYIFSFLGISFSSYIIGEGNKPGDILNDQEAISKAVLLNNALKQHITNYKSLDCDNSK